MNNQYSHYRLGNPWFGTRNTHLVIAPLCQDQFSYSSGTARAGKGKGWAHQRRNSQRECPNH